jgi:hypothetical protein
MAEKCKEIIKEEEIKKFVGDQIFGKYKKFKLEQEKFKDPNKKNLFCPIPDCEEIIECDQDLDKDPFFQCPKNHKFCGKCKTAGWHQEGKCNDVNYILNLII